MGIATLNPEFAKYVVEKILTRLVVLGLFKNQSKAEEMLTEEEMQKIKAEQLVRQMKAQMFGTVEEETGEDVPIEFADERLSTASASAKLREAGKSARNQKDLIDQAAALEILNDWLGEQQ